MSKDNGAAKKSPNAITRQTQLPLNCSFSTCSPCGMEKAEGVFCEPHVKTSRTLRMCFSNPPFAACLTFNN